jgi:PAS domain S-box-containing protein
VSQGHWTITLIPVIEYVIAIYLAYRLIGFRPDFPVWRGIWLWFAIMLSLLAYVQITTASLPPEINAWHRFVVIQTVGLIAIRIVWSARTIFPDGRTRPEPVAQVQMDWRGVIVDWNATAVKLLGWTADEAINQELATLLIPEDLTVETPMGTQLARDRHRDGLKHYQMTGEAPIINTRFQTTSLRKIGPPFAVDVYITAHVTAEGTRFLGAITPAPLIKV